MLNAVTHHMDALLPLKQLGIVCRFKTETRLPFFHQTVWPAYLYTLLNRLPPDKAKTACRFILPESGKTHYQQGDLYSFSVVLFGPNGSRIANQLVEKIPKGIDTDDARTLHNNLDIVEISDVFTGQTIQTVDELSEWGRVELNRQSQTLIDTSATPTLPLTLWLETGVLFKQPLRSASNLSAERLIQQLMLSPVYARNITQGEQTQHAVKLAEQIKHIPHDQMPHIASSHLFFINKTYANKHGKHKHLSGYHGRIKLNLALNHPDAQHYLNLLLLGQYLGIGKRTNYGIGQYQLDINGQTQKSMPPRAQSLLNDCLNLNDVIHNDDYAKLNDQQKQQALGIRDAILERRYQPSALNTFSHTHTQLNGKKKTRQISVAPKPERTLQKIVAKVLSQHTDSLQHNASYGYRPRRNRKQAVERIGRHIKYGNNWILESDVENCFDSISYDIVQTRIRGIFADQDLNQFILACLSAPYANAKNQPTRTCGIPQGSPLSPLIANLILTDLDYDLSQQGFTHIRFADDFVVLGKSQEELKRALHACKTSLHEQGLTLNEDKTRTTQAAENFIFLGYQIDEKHATDLSAQAKPKSPYPLEPNTIIQRGASPISRRGQTLFVCHQKHAQLTLSSNHLIISSDDKIERTPLSHIRLIILLGAHQITTQLAQYCLNEGINIHYLRHTGKYLGSLNSSQKTHQYKTELWLKQERHLTQPTCALELSRLIMQGRLNNMRKTLVEYQIKDTHVIDRKLIQLSQANDLNELRGYEGLATRYYYLQLNVLLKNTDFSFETRNRRPPKDPFNVLLSLGYTILYNYLESFLLTLDLNPDRGFYHYTQSHSIALCSDLIEPFRHYIERAAITVVRRKQIKTEHFYYHQSACCLTADGRKIYLRHLAQMLESSSKHGNIFKERRIEKIYRQAALFKQHLQQPDIVKFTAYRE